MKTFNRLLCLTFILAFLISVQGIRADELDELSDLAENKAEQKIDAKEEINAEDIDDLSELSDDNLSTEEENKDDTSDDLSDLDDSVQSADPPDSLGESTEDNFDEASSEEYDMNNEVEESQNSYTVGGYVKPLAYWSKTYFSKNLWQQYERLKSQGLPAPEKQKEDSFTDVGARFQVKLEGYLGERARFFMAVNADHNETEHDDPKSENKVIEAFVEIYEESRTWKIGKQIVTWGFMEGIEVPTDRVNARDFSYQSSEYEDIKIASSGILLKQSLGDFNFLDIMYIPVSKVNTDRGYVDFFYNKEDNYPEPTTDHSKWALRYFLNIDRLDMAVNYVEGIDQQADVFIDEDNDAQKTYNRVKSMGIDLQYNFGDFLAKFASSNYDTKDENGEDPFIKNNWLHYVFGVEFKVSSATINFYGGQIAVEDFTNKSEIQQRTNSMMGQTGERVDFISGHVSADFLTGNALGTTVLFAGYRDEDGAVVRQILKPTFTYNISDGLESILSLGYVEAEKSEFSTFQAEVKYSF